MFTTLITSLVVFVGVIMLLVGMLMFAKAKLTPSGKLNLVINGHEPVKIDAGSTLLTTLTEQKIFLPSACGGGGTCGMCRCQVLDGGGEILPTEVGFFSRKEINEDWRLGCQVKVREDMDIKVPEEVFGVKKWECEVLSNYNVATFIKEFVIKLPEGVTLDFQAGGYIQIDVPPIVVDYKGIDIAPHPDDPAGPEKYKPDWDKFGMWDLTMENEEPLFRAYSMASYPAENKVIKLNVRIATPPWDIARNEWMNVNPGVCSSYIFSLKPGDKVTVSGPYGEFFIHKSSAEMLYVGGGAGMAPMRAHLFHLFKTLKTKRKVSFWYGGRSKRELFYVDEFKALEKQFPNFTFNIVLSDPMPEDNWEGMTGFVHQAVIDHHLKKHPAPEEIEFYFCGPPMMNKAVLNMVDNWGIPDENVFFDDFGG
jgi:Na+-transporting NADH:ubiquinone oxidoreductase subunit F